MADEKLNTGPGEEKLPEAPAPVTADGPQTSAPVTADGPQAPAPVTADEPQAPAPEQAAAPTPQQEGPAQPEPGDVVVSFDKINELMNEKHAETTSPASSPSCVGAIISVLTASFPTPVAVSVAVMWKASSRCV